MDYDKRIEDLRSARSAAEETQMSLDPRCNNYARRSEMYAKLILDYDDEIEALLGDKATVESMLGAIRNRPEMRRAYLDEEGQIDLAQQPRHETDDMPDLNAFARGW